MDSYQLPDIGLLIDKALYDLRKEKLEAGDIIFSPEKFNIHYISGDIKND
tara:strand:+ start:3098 stop:3247 length:150 start_codon:yes stop_codon:yes gene_type:complete